MCIQTHRILIFLGMYGKNLVFGSRLYINVCAVTSVQHLFRFYMEPDGISSISISSFWLCGTKRWETKKHQAFLLCVIKSDCMRPGLDPIKEVHESVGGFLESLPFETWNIYWEYIQYAYIHLVYQKFSWRLLSILFPNRNKLVYSQKTETIVCCLRLTSSQQAQSLL